MSAIQQLLTDHIDIWTGADAAKRSGRGRASGNAGSVYGIKKLRELILELAVRGKLVPQDTNDEPASELLKRIQAEKEMLVKAGKIKKDKPLAEISEEEKLFELPVGWEWVRIGVIGNIFNGNSVNADIKENLYRNANGRPFIATKDVGYGFESLDYKNGIFIPFEEAGFKVAKNGAVLMCAEGGSAGKKCGITDQDICFGNKLFANELHGNINPRFILSIYLTPTFFSQFTSAMTGIIGGISSAKFTELIVPAAPLQEQHRIVAKVDELMALCDQLEAQDNKAAEAHEKIVSVLLQALTQSADANAFSDNWQRIAAHFDTLFTTEASIDDLKQTLLQLAVMGKLVTQDANDEPASELLKRVAPKVKVVPTDEEPFSLPQGWAWIKFGDALDFQGGGQPPKHAFSDTKHSGYVQLIQIRDLGERPQPVFIKKELAAKFCTENDIMIGRYGASVGKVFWGKDGAYNVALVKIIDEYGIYFNRFLYEFFRCPHGQSFFSGISRSAQAGFNKSDIEGQLMPVCSQAEQHRIVAKVDELMALCDQLKAKLNNAQITQLALADAMADQALKK